MSKRFSKGKKILVSLIVIFLVLIAGILNIPYTSGNIVHAMVEAYENLNSISGILEYDSNNYSEKIEFKFLKPNIFISVHESNGEKYTKIYDGKDVMYTTMSNSDKVRVDFMDSYTEKEQLSWLLLRNIADDLFNEENVTSINKLHSETIAGRNTEGYEITFEYNGYTTVHNIWVDKKLNLPLKWEIVYPGFTTEEGKVIPEERIAITFIEIYINPSFNNDTFSYQYDGSKSYYINTPPSTKEQFEKYSYLFDSDTISEYNKLLGFDNTKNNNTVYTPDDNQFQNIESMLAYMIESFGSAKEIELLGQDGKPVGKLTGDKIKEFTNLAKQSRLGEYPENLTGGEVVGELIFYYEHDAMNLTLASVYIHPGPLAYGSYKGYVIVFDSEEIGNQILELFNN